MAAMRARVVLLGLGAAFACFCAGVAFQRCSTAPPPPAEAARLSPALALDGGPLRLELGLGQDADGGKGAKLIFDPDSIELLPDASLRLELPAGFDAGSAR